MHAGSLNFQVFIFPIRYKTVSFHHQANYQIQFSACQKSFTAYSIHPICQLFIKQAQTKTDRQGNIWNVGGNITNLSHFKTNKFQIEYNDQFVTFKTGFITRLTPQDQTNISLSIDLVKHLENTQKPQQQIATKKISSQTISLNLKSNSNGLNMRRIVFGTNQYISFLDLAFQFVQLNNVRRSINAEEIGQRSLKLIYQSQVSDRLNIYQQLKIKTKQKINQFQLIKLEFSSKEMAKFSSQFQTQFVYKCIPDLDYLLLQLKEDQQNFDSNVGLNKFDRSSGKSKTIIDVFTQHYQCQSNKLVNFIKIQGNLIERNIRALFQRYVQLTISLFAYKTQLIEIEQINRVKYLITESEEQIRKAQNNSIRCLDFSLQSSNAFKQKMWSLMRKSSNIIGLQVKQPFVHILNYPILQKTNKLDVNATLTVFIHGYKGNQYDLSKIKSYLSLLLGFNNFYSIKGLSSDKANSQTIYKLGQTAANQLNNYLSIVPTYKHINIIGFSLGGLIARAMLPWIEAHKAKLNLLVTIASPHLGLREIESCMVRTALCYMRRVAGIESIRELNSERNQSKSRYLLELAEGKCLEWFKFIILVGSFVDSYIPAYSSLVQYNGEDQLTLEMSQRLGQKLKKAVRCVAQIEYKQTLFQLLTKRKSHISFLQEDSFIKYFVIKFQDLFTYGS